MKCTVPNRISYYLKLRGPSYVMDTGCSTTAYAIEHAYRAIKMGECENAIVGASNTCFSPNLTLAFKRLGVLAMDGTCRSFDADANGYVRSEAACVILLQKRKDAKRMYATIIHAKTGCDGFKNEGILHPSGYEQRQLLEQLYREAKVDPLRVCFVEAHSTGTKAGDPEEVRALDEVFCTGRDGPLLVGSVKSNIGHTEPVSALCSISKVLLAMETGIIPANIHYKKARAGVTAIEEGRIAVATENTPFKTADVLVGKGLLVSLKIEAHLAV